MKKLLFLFAFLFAFNANASTIPEGAIVKSANNPDVYIVKYNAGKQYKRLVLNPLVFKSYGHLKWENLLTVSQSEMDSFLTSDLVRVDGSTDIYQLVPEGDNGGKYQLTSIDGYDLSSIYTINSVDFSNYEARGTKGVTAEETKRITDQVLVDAEKKIEAERLEAERKLAEAKQSVEDQIKLERLEWGTSALSKLAAIIGQTDTDLALLIPQIEKVKLNIENVHGGGISQAEADGREANYIKEYNALVDKYNPLLEKKNRIMTISYEIDDYVKYGIVIPAADRAYLNSLGISV